MQDDAAVVDDAGCARRRRRARGRRRRRRGRGRVRRRRRRRRRRAATGTSRRATMSPSRVSTAPMKTSLPDRSMPTMRCPARSRSTRIAGLPGPDASRTPISATKPSAMSSAIRSEIVTRVSPVSRDEIRPAHRALVEQRLQQQGAVVAAGVLRQHLARPDAAHDPGRTGGRSRLPWVAADSRVEEPRCASDAVMFVSRPYELTFPQVCSPVCAACLQNRYLPSPRDQALVGSWGG